MSPACDDTHEGLQVAFFTLSFRVQVGVSLLMPCDVDVGCCNGGAEMEVPNTLCMWVSLCIYAIEQNGMAHSSRHCEGARQAYFSPFFALLPPDTAELCSWASTINCWDFRLTESLRFPLRDDTIAHVILVLPRAENSMS